MSVPNPTGPPMANPNRKSCSVIWVTKDRIWHKRAKRFITRKDGKPFRFPIFKR
ncbi:hypothetical protein MalM14_07390 [Gimesia chilikensis]|nr:hypothetical protein MalM14_07390 [Gimesia chilikensis]